MRPTGKVLDPLGQPAHGPAQPLRRPQHERVFRVRARSSCRNRRRHPASSRPGSPAVRAARSRRARAGCGAPMRRSASAGTFRSRRRTGRQRRAAPAPIAAMRLLTSSSSTTCAGPGEGCGHGRAIPLPESERNIARRCSHSRGSSSREARRRSVDGGQHVVVDGNVVQRLDRLLRGSRPPRTPPHRRHAVPCRDTADSARARRGRPRRRASPSRAEGRCHQPAGRPR